MIVKRLGVVFLASFLSLNLTLLCAAPVSANEVDKYYSDNAGAISNDGYWGKKRGHLGGEEKKKVNPVKTELEEPEFEPFAFPRPKYSNLSFGLTLQSNYDDYERHGTTLKNNPGFDYVLDDVFEDDVVWQANLHRNNDDLVLSNGLGVMSEDSLLPFGFNAFVDAELGTGNTRFSLGSKYEDPDYIFNLSSNFYKPIAGDDEPGDLAPSIDVRAEGAISPVIQFHASAEYYFGDNIQLSDDYDPTDGSHKLTAGLDYTPIPLIQLGVEATKVESHDMGYGVYLYFNYDPWEPFDKQIESILDTDFAQRKMIPFSRSNVMARFSD